MVDTNGHTNGNGNGKRLEAAAESATVKILARGMMIFMPPLILGAGAWFANKVITATDENTKALIELRSDFKALVEAKLPGITSTLNSRIDAETGALRGRIDAHVQRLETLDRRFDQQERRDQGQDGKIEELQRRVWQVPSAAPAPVQPAQPSIQPYPR